MSYSNGIAPTKTDAYDTGLFDENIHDNQIVAMYDTDAQAKAARDMLVSKGVTASSMEVVSRSTDAGTASGMTDESGVWGALKSLFVPDDDRTAYSHAVGRGHAMLVVMPGAGADRSAIVHALESTNPVDFDAKLEEWRQAGYDTSTAHADYAASMTPAMDSPVAAMADRDPVVTGTATPPAMARGVADERNDGDTIKVMEERLRVGKREVAAGAVRIRSYIVERPVEEQVSLHQESVHVERHAVDRAASPADMTAFQERTMEARATSEEAVVSKEARVIEEIGLTKTSSDRVETVRDTLRKTEVEVEDGTTAIDPATGKPRTTPRV